MKRVLTFGAASLLAMFALAAAPLSAAQKPAKNLKPLGKTVWNLEGGAFFATDGRIPNGPCFRINGQATAADFFEKLKRIDDDSGTRYLHGTQEVTEYPPRLKISLQLHDLPCSFLLKDKTLGPPLTKEDVSKLKLRLYWKHGVALRPTERAIEPTLYIRTLEPNIKPDANDLQERYEWNFTFGLPSEGVPLEDSLVLSFETADGAIAARTSARL
jgi:hypothetical protein